MGIWDTAAGRWLLRLLAGVKFPERLPYCHSTPPSRPGWQYGQRLMFDDYDERWPLKQQRPWLDSLSSND